MYKKGNINIFKLTSGEEFLAKITDLTGIALTVSNPFYLVKNEKGEINPIPFMPVAQAEVKIMKDHIVALGVPTDGAIKGYNNMTKVELLTE